MRARMPPKLARPPSQASTALFQCMLLPSPLRCVTVVFNTMRIRPTCMQAGHDTLNAWPRGSYDQAGGGTKADQARVQGAALAQEEGVARGDAPAGVTDGEVV